MGKRAALVAGKVVEEVKAEVRAAFEGVKEDLASTARYVEDHIGQGAVALAGRVLEGATADRHRLSAELRDVREAIVGRVAAQVPPKPLDAAALAGAVGRAVWCRHWGGAPGGEAACDGGGR